MSAPVLQVAHLSKSFAGKNVLEDLTFTLEGPQVVGLLGLNGAGKTTLMRLLTGFLPPDSGSITIAGQSLATDAIRTREAIGYLPENAPVHHGLRVSEALHFTASLHGLRGERAREAIDNVVTLCQLAPVLHRIAAQLSKGYRHRLGLALALLHRPPFLALDEPTDGLDPLQKLATRQLLRQLGRHHTILVSTHLLEEVPEICSRVLLLQQGHLTYDGPVPQNLLGKFC